MTDSPDFVHLPIFVYGTLQRGEERGHLWPRAPLGIETAWIVGRLHDLGPYPALVAGTDRIRGELWHLRLADMAETLRVLDEIECSGNDDVDLYVRRIVACHTATGVPCDAYTYFLADFRRAGDFPVVRPLADGFCHWRCRTRPGGSFPHQMLDGPAGYT